MTLTIGTRVSVKDTYFDEAMQTPVTGTVKDIFPVDGVTRYVVMFDGEDIRKEKGMFPPGGEFSLDRLEAAGGAR